MNTQFQFFIVCYPVYLPLLAVLGVLTFFGLRSKEKSRLFIIALTLNAFAVCSTISFCVEALITYTSIMIFCLGFCVCIPIAGLLCLITLARLCYIIFIRHCGKVEDTSYFFLYEILTLIHCGVACHWLYNGAVNLS